MNVNTILARRDPQGDLYDRLVVVGYFDAGEYGTELVLQPADSFGSPFTASEQSVHRAYGVEQEGVDAKPWETPLVEGS
jgi:hypothetical protein